MGCKMQNCYGNGWTCDVYIMLSHKASVTKLSWHINNHVTHAHMRKSRLSHAADPEADNFDNP